MRANRPQLDYSLMLAWLWGPLSLCVFSRGGISCRVVWEFADPLWCVLCQQWGMQQLCHFFSLRRFAADRQCRLIYSGDQNASVVLQIGWKWGYPTILSVSIKFIQLLLNLLDEELLCFPPSEAHIFHLVAFLHFCLVHSGIHVGVYMWLTSGIFYMWFWKRLEWDDG